MTVKYTHKIAEATLLGFIKLLFRWKGSMWKLIWKDVLIFGTIYVSISLSYYLAFNDEQKTRFQQIALYCNLNSYKIPLAFVLGFYVSQVVSRFWLYFNSIPWPSTLAYYVNIFITGEDENTRKYRRTVMRYVCCTFTMVMRSICQPVKKRFPTLNHLVEAGLLTEEEETEVKNFEVKCNHYFIPIVWGTSLISTARKQGMIKKDIDQERLIMELNAFRSGCSKLIRFDWVTLPLVYTQVVSVAVYLFSFTCLLGRYPFIKEGNQESYFPFFTLLQFVFYIAWLKVGEAVANPFGEDDDDFDVNILIDCFVQESFIVVDQLKTSIPKLVKDQHWNRQDFSMPQLNEVALVEFLGSAGGIKLVN
ncbi:hypothetical protein HELRODRAFT_65946 [Helobdella robusta]|uniref:Bestrophin homolog n=1 Tax=Helobdella robusta TaxID=6412 RepID=T1FYE8_HELRO|nr:hypothetical protein HELRODRAFT_65946 [Helobdella robusta]ESO02503.1 hypothetical protein HELRODRAFT_65946 [Helobdella robusta]